MPTHVTVPIETFNKFLSTHCPGEQSTANPDTSVKIQNFVE